MTDIRQALEEAFVTIFGPEPDSEYDGRAWKRNEPDFSPTWTAYINKRTRFHRFLDAEAWTDAAMCLVPEGWGWNVSQPNAKAIASGLLKEHTPVRGEVENGFEQRFIVAAETPAHALLAACLKAKEQADV